MNNQKQSFQYIFGPVPSRRLGLSLGVDLMPHKTCTLDCVYCECGKTTNLTLKRKEYVPLKSIVNELTTFLSTSPKLDYITFSGSGEPTLHSGIGQIIQFLKTDFPQYKIALLTNGTLFYQESLINQTRDVDIIIASIDAISSEIFNIVNRPYPGLLVENIISGLVDLKNIFPNQLWIEYFVVPGKNNSKEELKKIKSLLDKLKPDKVQINTLDRPGTEDWVNTIDKEQVKNLSDLLSGAEAIEQTFPEQNARTTSKDFNLQLLAMIKRRPCTEKDIAKSLGISIDTARQQIHLLIEKGTIKIKKMPRGTFYMTRT